MTNFKSGLRALLNTPAFSVTAMLTLAIGIGANAALFSVYDRLVLNVVSVPRPDTLVAVFSFNPQFGAPAWVTSWPKFAALARQAHSFSSAAISSGDTITLTGESEDPDQLNALRISGAFFASLGVTPVRGRDFSAADDVPNGPKVCLLSDSLWTSKFGRADAVVGRNIQLNGQSWEVIGILPPLTAPFRQAQIFLPRVFDVGFLQPQQVEVGAGYAQAVARLAPGVSIEQAAAELRTFGDAYRKEFPTRLDANGEYQPRLFTDAVVGNLRPTMYTLLGAVGFVLIIACANVSSLFVGRLGDRHREIAVRLALGATREAIMRQFLTESLILAAAAGATGAVLARFGLSAIQQLASSQLPPNTIFVLNWRAWAFIAGASVASAALVGLAPALQASKATLVDALKDAARGSSGGRGGGRLRASLIVGEVALSIILLVGSTLLLVSFVSLQRTPTGYDASGVATAFVSVPAGRYAKPPAQAEFFEQVIGALRADPRITQAAASLGLPISGFNARAPYSVIGRPILPLPERPLANLQIASEDYFAMLRIPIVAGRAFTAEDRDGAPNVCLINQTLAAKLFPHESPIGRVLARGRDAEIQHTIVGVVADVRSNGVTAPVPDEVYYPMRQLGKAGMSVSARTTGDPTALQSAIRAAVARVDRDQPISFFQTLDSALVASLGQQRLVASLAACFAAIALVLAAVGLYSVVAAAVAQRTGEIGIRMALGARPGQVLSLIMRGGMKLVAIGVVIGLMGASAIAQAIRSQLANVTPLDPVVYGLVAAFFAVVAALACLVPSLRASRINPLLAMGDRRPVRT